MSDTERAPPPVPKWVSMVRGEIRSLKEALENTGGDVKELTRIARNCFEHLLIQEGRIDKLERTRDDHELELRNLRRDVAALQRLSIPPANGSPDAA